MRGLGASVESQAKTIISLDASAKARCASRIEVQNEHANFSVDATMLDGAVGARALGVSEGAEATSDSLKRVTSLRYEMRVRSTTRVARRAALGTQWPQAAYEAGGSARRSATATARRGGRGSPAT